MKILNEDDINNIKDAFIESLQEPLKSQILNDNCIDYSIMEKILIEQGYNLNRPELQLRIAQKKYRDYINQSWGMGGQREFFPYIEYIEILEKELIKLYKLDSISKEGYKEGIKNETNQN